MRLSPATLNKQIVVAGAGGVYVSVGIEIFYPARHFTTAAQRAAIRIPRFTAYLLL